MKKWDLFSPLEGPCQVLQVNCWTKSHTMYKSKGNTKLESVICEELFLTKYWI